MRKVIAIIIFFIVQIICLPCLVLGIALTYYKQMHISRKLRVSSTAVEIINGRWTMDRFGLRKDPATVLLFNALPNTTAIGLWLTLFPSYLLKLIAGQAIFYPTIKKDGNETLGNLVTSRTIYFDSILERSLKNSEQFVVLGAGYDTRCYGE